MPFQLKIQPIDDDRTVKIEQTKPAAKSRLKRFFERRKEKEKDDLEVEPGSISLDKLVVNFIEEGNERSTRNCCNCFSGEYDDSSDDETERKAPVGRGIISVDALDLLKELVHCEISSERNLLSDVSKIVESNKCKVGKGKNDYIRTVVEHLKCLCYDASICRTKWEKSASIPAGEYEYIEVIVGSDRLIVDIDFRAEFEIARSTKFYRSLLQFIPAIYVGKSDRMDRILTVVSEAARASLKKKGLHFPPWRKLEYMKAKWLSACIKVTEDKSTTDFKSSVNCSGKFETSALSSVTEKMTALISPWTPPAVKPKSVTAGNKIVTGLSSVMSPTPSEF